jgi:hypothetical protein
MSSYWDALWGSEVASGGSDVVQQRWGRDLAERLRELFGNPFRPVSLAPAVLAWQGGTVRKFAESIYDEPAFERLPVLADALEDAGCRDEALVRHCRVEGPHVRGCWAVDLILGKR